jgi:hypothetical protein
MVFTTGCDRKASSAQKPESRGSARSDLWRVYNRSLKGAKYIDLTHTHTYAIDPGVEGLQFLHEERHILFHGHEPLDTDTTPNLEGEAWLMQNGYAEAEGVANLDRVPEKGCLITIRRRPGRLRALYRHMSGGLEIRRVSRRSCRSASAHERQGSSVGGQARHGRKI